MRSGAIHEIEYEKIFSSIEIKQVQAHLICVAGALVSCSLELKKYFRMFFASKFQRRNITNKTAHIQRTSQLQTQLPIRRSVIKESKLFSSHTRTQGIETSAHEAKKKSMQL